MKKLLFFFLAIPLFAKGNPTRSITINENDVAEIRTALRYSTVLEFDARPLSVILGDQDAFKAEYIGNSLTIKPMMPSSTNLFVMTDYDKFNFKIRTTSADKADYKVRVKKKPAKGVSGELSNENGTKIHFRPIEKSTHFKDIALELTSIGSPKAKNLYLLTFSLALMRNGPMEDFPFKAQDFHVRQGKREVAIDSLNLERLELSRNKPMMSGTIIIKASDLKGTENPNLVFSPEKRKPLSIAVPLTAKERGMDENQASDRQVFLDGKEPIFR